MNKEIDIINTNLTRINEENKRLQNEIDKLDMIRKNDEK